MSRGMTDSGWVPLALSVDVAEGTATGAVLDGVELVIWRDTAGVCHIWEDRCPHRGMKLSLGFVRNNRLTCLYHGWEYDAHGRCQIIPAHPDLDVPETICASRFASAEAAGLIWVYVPLGGESQTFPADVDVTPIRSIYMNASLGRATAILDCQGQAHHRVISPYGASSIGFHAMSDTQCAMHITALGLVSRETQLAMCDWAVSLRDKIEGGAEHDFA